MLYILHPTVFESSKTFLNFSLVCGNAPRCGSNWKQNESVTLVFFSWKFTLAAWKTAE